MQDNKQISFVHLHCIKQNEINIHHSDVQKHVPYTGSQKMQGGHKKTLPTSALLAPVLFNRST